MAPQAQPRGRLGLLAMLLACGFLAAILTCVQRPPRVRRAADESEAVELPACPTPTPPLPRQAAREGQYGVVLVGYTIEPDGRVDEIDLEDPAASPLLFSAARDWLTECRASPQGRVQAKRISELLTFPPPELRSVEETPVPLDTASGMTPPRRSSGCTPAKPPAAVPGHGTLTVEYVVHSNGRLGDVVLQGGDAPKPLFKAIRAWLQSCPYTPASRGGQPVAVRMRESFTF